ncbi:PD-(D/E)XK nuclease family protein [Bifidobacterium catulorum]|uniref:UvrD-like helicase C-terminal domain-containing protein n=1 Tax=Bifidobacterium catulorum TaxID=1630173 RepID=A0A2U2MQG3_9BIFI|nr:PD-(D/E)XK nuclease family protein [Bifidobacterium catulorum]PWG59084.1 hypothetical protein DF200_09470 [Bifidobacterium catulorum]
MMMGSYDDDVVNQQVGRMRELAEERFPGFSAKACMDPFGLISLLAEEITICPQHESGEDDDDEPSGFVFGEGKNGIIGQYELTGGHSGIIRIACGDGKELGDARGIRRRNFTLLHEIGHHLQQTDKDLIFTCSITNDAAKSFEEDACDRFASLMLVPDDLVEQFGPKPGEPVEARHAAMLFANSQASREVVALRVARMLGDDDYVSVIYRDNENVGVRRYGNGRSQWKTTVNEHERHACDSLPNRRDTWKNDDYAPEVPEPESMSGTSDVTGLTPRYHLSVANAYNLGEQGDGSQCKFVIMRRNATSDDAEQESPAERMERERHVCDAMANPGLAATIAGAFDDAATGVTNTGAAPRTFIITPARLRATVERATLEYLRDQVPGRLCPGVTIGVHSFSSLVRSVIGGHDGGSFVRPVVSPFALRAFVAQEMTHRQELFRESGRLFGSVNQYASQIEELRKGGVTSADIPADSQRLKALRALLASVERKFGSDATMTGEVGPAIRDWLHDHGRECRFHLYGFEKNDPSEALAIAAMHEYAHVMFHPSADAAATVGDEPAYQSLIGILDGNDRSRRSLPAILRPYGHTIFRSYAMNTPADELRFVAQDIRNQVQKAGGALSYGDILVTARDLSQYRAMMEPEFTYRRIPINATPASTMRDHPLAGLMLGLLDPAFSRREPVAILRVLRSGLLHNLKYSVRPIGGIGEWKPIRRADLDRLENLLITSDAATIWEEAPEDSLPGVVDAFRSRISKAIGFQDDTKRTVREVLTDMVTVLADAGVTSAQWDENQGDAETKRRDFAQTQQVWHAIMNAFDDMVRHFGDAPFEDFAPTFADNLATLLAMQPLGVRPKAMNAVDVVAFPTAMRPYRLIYVLGAGESQLPAIPHETGLLDDSERRTIAAGLDRNGKNVSAWALRSRTVEAKALREPIAFNLVTRNAAERLTVTYPKTTADGAQEPSRYVKAMSGAGEPVFGLSESGAHQDLDSHLVDLPDEQRPLDPELATRMFASREDVGDPTSPLVFNASVSSIEQYYSNPYDFFLHRGLKVDPLRPYDLDPMLEGTFYHAVLEHAVGEWMVRRPGEPPQAEKMVDIIRDYARIHREDGRWSVLDDDPRMTVLESSNRMKAVHGQMIVTLLNMNRRMVETRASWAKTAMKCLLPNPKSKEGKTKEYRGTTSVPLYTEQQFGDLGNRHCDWSALPFDPVPGVISGLTTPIPVVVNGKIDRVERIENAQCSTSGLLVFDYKSSYRSLFGKSRKDKDDKEDKDVEKGKDDKKGKDGAYDGSQVYYGHELQLFTYAAAVKANVSDDVPVAGMFFVPIRRKETETYQYSEMFSLTAGPEDGKSALDLGSYGYISVKRKKAGQGLAGAGLVVKPWSLSNGCKLESSSVDAIDAFVHRKIQDACAAIFAGELPIRPFKEIRSGQDGRDGVKYSDYADVIALDLIVGDAYDMQPPVTLKKITQPKKDNLRFFRIR